ncbi:putative reverse transcriptase domain-containing protein [Tanacetum coccineum]
MLAQVSNQGNVGNPNGNVVNENVQENVGNVIEYDGKGGAVVLTRWIEKIEYVHDMSSCSIDQKVKYTAGSFVVKALTWWNSQIRTLSQEVAVSMSWNDFKFMMIEEFCPSHEMQKLESKLWNHAMVGAGHAAYTAYTESRMIESALTDEAVRNGSIKKVEKRGNVGEPSKDKNGKDDNKRTRTEKCFCYYCKPYRKREYGYLAKDCKGVPRNVIHVNARNPTIWACYECGSTDHVRSACPRLNRAEGPEENCPNQVDANNRGQGRRNQGNQARGRAFMLGAEEARQDPNIMTGTFTLNSYFATTLFDSGADYRFVSTTFIPLLGLEPSELGFKYEIEIASGQLVEIDKVVKGYKLEIEGHVFDIDLIPFGHGIFDVIIGMDWLSNYKAEIICHKKVVRIPLPDAKVLRVLGERPEVKARFLMGAMAGDKKQEDIVVVRYFPRATPATKSPYRLAPSELEELSGQLKELQDKGFIRPSSSPWGALEASYYKKLGGELLNGELLNGELLNSELLNGELPNGELLKVTGSELVRPNSGLSTIFLNGNAGSKDRPPMLGPGRYSQWRSCFLRYIDPKGNGENLRKCIFEGPYKLTSVVIEAVAATVNSPEVPEHDEAETIHNMFEENKLYFKDEKEAIFLLLTGIGYEIYSTVDACNTA